MYSISESVLLDIICDNFSSNHFICQYDFNLLLSLYLKVMIWIPRLSIEICQRVSPRSQNLVSEVFVVLITSQSPGCSFDILATNSPPAQLACQPNRPSTEVKWMRITRGTAPMKITRTEAVASNLSKRWMKMRKQSCEQAHITGAHLLTPRRCAELGTNSTNTRILLPELSDLSPVCPQTGQQWMAATCLLLCRYYHQASPWKPRGAL